MKLPLMLRSTHDREMRLERHVLNELKDDYVDINYELHKVNKENLKLENSNSELAIKLTAATTKANKYEGWYYDITYLYRDSQNELNDKSKEVQEIKRKLDSYKKKVDAFEILYSEYKEQVNIFEKDMLCMGNVYNNMNRKLWSNDEAKRQLRNLAKEIREADKINKNYIAKYLDDLSMLIGGGDKYEFVGIYNIEASAKEGVKVEKA